MPIPLGHDLARELRVSMEQRKAFSRGLQKAKRRVAVTRSVQPVPLDHDAVACHGLVPVAGVRQDRIAFLLKLRERALVGDDGIDQSVLQRLRIATEFQNRDVEGRIPSHAAREQPGHEAGRGPLAIDPQTFALQVFQSFQAAPSDDVRASQAVAARQGDHRAENSPRSPFGT